MKTPIQTHFLLAPLSAALLALGALVLPGFGAPTAAAARGAASVDDSKACVPKKGGNPAACKELVQLEVRDVAPAGALQRLRDSAPVTGPRA